MAQTEKPHERTASTDQRTSWSWRRLFGKDDSSALPATPPLEEDTQRPGVVRRISRKVVPGLPRPGTFKRQQSELRDRLEPIRPNTDERRAVSMDRRRNTPSRDASTPGRQSPRLSAPELLEKTETIDSVLGKSAVAAPVEKAHEEHHEFVDVSKDASHVETASFTTEAFEDMISDELERRWILNLSMHFRDKSKREKFFVTYAETPTHLRRVTVSLDYREAPPGSLEEELQHTKFQRDKSARIYEAIRESLQDIQFYDTVTNLKLQTENERLHVHVVEDVSEIIAYPPVKAINHLRCRRVREDQIVFDSHLSGFVYKVKVDGQTFIKKEIPGPDTVDEFLYEINALHQLTGARSVIQFGGVVLDNKGELVKGLLISFAEQGALIDVIYDGEGQIPWKRRERWAKQVVQGLSEIHEAGFVQGDFTLSNIVVDEDDNAKIIDINRRGCPVGWEPPEVAALIENNQRISMYIGVKSDLFQLGMVLYALAFQFDEPENQPRPLNLSAAPSDVPEYFLDICRRCLSDDPRQRSQAAALYTLFPEVDEVHGVHDMPIPPIVIDAHYHHRDEASDDPHDSGVEGSIHNLTNGDRSHDSHTYVDSGELADEPYYFPRRGRSPPREEVVTSDIPYSNLHAPGSEDAGINLSMSMADEKLQTVDESVDDRHTQEKLPTVDEIVDQEPQHISQPVGDERSVGVNPQPVYEDVDDKKAHKKLQPVEEEVDQEPSHIPHPVGDAADDKQVQVKSQPVDESTDVKHADEEPKSVDDSRQVEEKPQPTSESVIVEHVEDEPQLVSKSIDDRQAEGEAEVVVERADEKEAEKADSAGKISDPGPQHTDEIAAEALPTTTSKIEEPVIDASPIKNSILTTEQEPRNTAAVTNNSHNNNSSSDNEKIPDPEKKLCYYPNDLAGVGGIDTNPTAYFANLPLPSTLDDDFTTTTTADAETAAGAHNNDQRSTNATRMVVS